MKLKKRYQKGEIKIPMEDLKKLNSLKKKYDEFFSNVVSDTKIKVMPTTEEISDKLPELNIGGGEEKIAEKPVELPQNTYKYVGLKGKNKLMVAKLKMLVNTIAKMEAGMKNSEYWKESVFSRGLNINNKKYKEQFVNQYKDTNDIVMTQWSSSSSFNSYGFSGDTKVKIVGGGIFIKDLSKHSKENEVLHKPFTLFRNIHMSEENGKRIINVAKIG